MSKDDCRSQCDQRMIMGNSIDIMVKSCDCEIKADISVCEYESVRLWGQVKNCNDQPVANALLKLLKVVHCAGRCEYQGVAHTLSDCAGFYQFDLSLGEIGCDYRILVSRANSGCERTLCHEESCTPGAHCNAPSESNNACIAPYECRPANPSCNCR